MKIILNNELQNNASFTLCSTEVLPDPFELIFQQTMEKGFIAPKKQTIQPPQYMNFRHETQTLFLVAFGLTFSNKLWKMDQGANDPSSTLSP